MPPKRENGHDESVELARVSREVREHDEKPRFFDPANTWYRGAQVLLALGLVYGFGGAVQNYNYRLTQQDARIRRLERQVVYTSEWRAWHKVFQLKNTGKLDSPDPADFTVDRTE